MPPPHRKYPSLFWWRGSSSYAPPPHLTLVPLFAAIPVRGAADTKEGGTRREGEGSGWGEQSWHRPWESRARVAMTTEGSEAALSGGAVGWGLAEGLKLGTAPWGGPFLAPPPVLSFLGIYPSSLTPPPHSIASLPCSPSPGARLEATPSHPLRPGSYMFLTPQQMDAFTAFTSRLPPGLPSHTCIPTLPVLPAITRPLSTSQHLAGPPPVRGPGLPGTPILPLPFPSTPP